MAAGSDRVRGNGDAAGGPVRPAGSESAESSAAPIVRLLRYARGFRRKIWQATACSILNKVFDLAPPLLIGAAVDVVVKRQDSLLARLRRSRDVQTQLWVLAGLTFVIWVLESLFEYLYGSSGGTWPRRSQHELRLDAYAHVQDLELAWFEDRSTGGLLSILNDDVNQLERFLDGGANDLIQVRDDGRGRRRDLLLPRPGRGLDRRLAADPVHHLGLRSSSSGGSRRATPTCGSASAILNALLANNLAGIATIKAFTAEEREVERVARRERGLPGRATARPSASAPPSSR